MPSIVTHELFSKDVIKSSNISNKIDINLYTIFAQGFDELFYYSFFFPFKGKLERKLANYAHRNKVNEYFKNIICYIKNNHLENDYSLLAYLYGSICHYVLDKKCHPYIYYYSGDVNQDSSKSGAHEKMEVAIDAYMLKYKDNLELYKESMTKRLFPKANLNHILEDCMDKVYKDTFGVPNMGKKYFKGVNTGRFIMRFFVTDHFGIKKVMYKVKDYIVPNIKRKYQYLSFHVKKIDEGYLNLNHEEWKIPARPSISSNLSFIELYDESVRDVVKIINSIEKYFNGKNDLDNVLKVIGNDSYVLGIPCDEICYMTTFKE